MSVLLNIRSYRRPDQPQPVYKGALGLALWEPYLYASIGDAQRSGTRTSERFQDRMCVLQTVPDDGWVPQRVDTVVAGWGPVFSSALRAERTVAAPRLDVRRYDWFPDDGWIPRVTDTAVSTWTPSIGADRRGERTSNGPALDVRGAEWSPPPAWIFSNLPSVLTTAQIWPAILEAVGLSYRSLAGPTLDVRRVDPPGFGWVQSAADAVVQGWTPNWSTGRTGERSPDRPRLDVRDWANEPGWLPNAADRVIATWTPVFDAEVGVRTADGPRLEVRRPEWSPESGWLFSVADAIVASWSSVFAAERLGARTPDGIALDVRRPDWSPLPAWIFTNLPGGVTQAQLWPAILQALGLAYRSADGRRLDVRQYDWAPESSWTPRAADAVIASWSGIFAPERMARTGERPKLDVRGYDWSPEVGWIPKATDLVIAKWMPGFIDHGQRTPERARLDVRGHLWGTWPTGVASAIATPEQLWPAILQALDVQFRTRERARLDVRGVTPPIFDWPQPVVDAIVAKWAPVFLAEMGSRTRDGVTLDVRDYGWDATNGWPFRGLPSLEDLFNFIRLGAIAFTKARLTVAGFTATALDAVAFETIGTLVEASVTEPALASVTFSAPGLSAVTWVHSE